MSQTTAPTFLIICDTREQHPYDFGKTPACRAALATGDYSVAGFASEICVERKSLADFCKTVIHDWERFQRELARMQKYAHCIIIVEADLDRALRGEYKEDTRGVSVQSLLGKTSEIEIYYGVPVLWAGSRQAAVVATESWLRVAARKAAQTTKGKP